MLCNMCSQHVYIYECRFTEEEAIVLRMPLTTPLSLTPATAAPRPAKVSPPIKLPVLDERLRISSSKVLPVLSALHDMPPDLAVVQSPGPPRRRHHPTLVTLQPSKMLHIRFLRRTIYDHFPHRQRRRYILAASIP